MRIVSLGFEYGQGGRYTDMGCSPCITSSLTDWLRTMKGVAEELYVAQYLFNNQRLYNAFEDLAKSGCKVIVFSIPLEGYDASRPMTISSYRTGERIGAYTKLDLAQALYSKAALNNDNGVRLRIVPHMYLRSSRVHAFSRGNMPYSLHCKTFLMKCSDGKNYAGLTSSNLAVRDAEKIEMGVIYQIDGAELFAADDFFAGLFDNSIPISRFDENGDYSHYKTVMRACPPKSRLMFIAPFYRNSAVQFEENIITIITHAKRELTVCAQHVCAYNYSFEGSFATAGAPSGTVVKGGFLEELLNRTKSGVPTRILSQTYVDANGTHGCRAPENRRSFSEFASAAKNAGCQYFVNPNLHSKYLVADDNIIITTCNFTPTQFIYLENVDIQHFDEIPGYSYKGVHCEYGVYAVSSSTALSEYMNRSTKGLIELSETRRMF